jgi:carbonic anhydrase
MNNELPDLFEHNKAWARRMEQERPGFFTALSKQQHPKYMWIGCSDSRVPANQITGLEPGEVFVHRNVGNVVVHSDLNSLSTIQFAVERLKVQHVIVCGHYNCSGVAAAHENARVGLADNWIRHIQDVRNRHAERLDRMPEDRRINALIELNVIEQVMNVCHSTVMQDAWQRKQDITVHGWVYGVNDGLLKDLRMTINSAEQMADAYTGALSMVQWR